MLRKHPLLITALAALAFSVVVNQACVSLFDIGGYRDAGQRLCEYHGQCFDGSSEALPSCAEHVATRLSEATPSARTQWLSYYGERNCEENCTIARLCVDEVPVCLSYQSPCQSGPECCGFSDSGSACENGRCCRATRNTCESDEDCCLDGESCILDEGRGETCCGGLCCKQTEETCFNNYECCSGKCEPKDPAEANSEKVCAPVSCFDNGATCTEDRECCSEFCNEQGQCGTPPCLLTGQSCENASECCGAFCVAARGGKVCNAQDCLPTGAACQGGEGGADGCCGDDICNDTQHCGAPSDEEPEPCKELGENCGALSDCCTEVCERAGAGGGALGDSSDGGAAPTCTCREAAGECEKDINCCGDVACTLPYSTSSVQRCACVTPSTTCTTNEMCTLGGPPLSPDCVSTKLADCVADICAELPECCCTGWTKECRNAATSKSVGCGIVCTGQSFP